MFDEVRGYQGPSDYTRARAQITDDQLVDGVRVAFIAVWWWFDAWWHDEGATAGKYGLKRAEMVRSTRDTLTAHGADISLDEIVAIGSPLLGEFWPSSSESASGLTSAIDGLRDAILHRVTSVRRARDEVTRWDGKRVLRTR